MNSSLTDYNELFEKIVNLKNKIEEEINKINNLYDKVFKEIEDSYKKKHEKLLIEENNLKENLQNEVTKIKEKLENFLSQSNNSIRIGERINKSIKIYQKDENKSINKTLSYISYISKNKKEMEIFLVYINEKYQI